MPKNVQTVVQFRSFHMLVMLCYTKSLQLCLTLCDPIDGSPPGSPIPGTVSKVMLKNLQARLQP